MSTTHTDSDTGISATVAGFGLSYAITSLFNVLLVIVKENVPGVEDLMKGLTGHHWVSHGLIVLIVFVILGYALRGPAARMPVDRLINYIVGSTVISGLALAFYFTVA